MKNDDSIQSNTVSAEKFTPPMKCDVYMDEKLAGSCYVRDAAAWRNRRDQKSARPETFKRLPARPKSKAKPEYQ